MKDYLTKGNYTKIVIESSPLLRTLETAVAIAKELQVNQITVKYQIFEWLKDEMFPDGSPVDTMLFTKTQS